jgi:hypothetical protein
MIRLSTLTILLLAVGTVTTAVAQTPTQLGTFRDWTAYTYNDQRGKVCFAASQPTDTEPKNVNRDPVFFMVSNRPVESVRNEASVIIGYPFKADSKVTAEVDGQSYTMFTKGDGAWVENAAEEQALIAAMKAGRQLVVKGTSQRGTLTTDSYPLTGITAAINRIDQECP